MGVKGGLHLRTKWHSLFRMNSNSSNQGFAVESPVVQKLCVICVYIYSYMQPTNHLTRKTLQEMSSALSMDTSTVTYLFLTGYLLKFYMK